MKQRLKILVFVISFVVVILGIKLVYLMIYQSDKYQKMAQLSQERERSLKAPRGKILDRNGVVLADNKSVYTISVIHNQIADYELVISVLSEKLNIDEEDIRKKVKKVSSIEKIKSNVDEKVAKSIIEENLEGVYVDEDSKRYYPYNTLLSKVLGFTGADNQGIVGLEAKYESTLVGKPGSINQTTAANGTLIENGTSRKVESVPGNNLVISVDANIQSYIEAKANEVLKKKNANRVCIIVMNPGNGEILGLTDTPEYNLNEPFSMSDSMDELNRIWRCFPINDTYEPGSAFKIVTSTAAFEHKSIDMNDMFYCPGYKLVGDRRIRCHKVTGHGSENFKQGIQNSCNPVFIEVGSRVGTKNFYETLKKLGFFDITGIDLNGEANSIFHKMEKVGVVELATISFGQSFQITPMQLLRGVSAVINGGKLITPHFGIYVTDSNNNIIEQLEYETKNDAVSLETSDKMKMFLESVVSEGSGNRAYIEGYSIGGKTATSEKLPRSKKKYISSFISFAPAENPQVIILVLIDEPEGVYYGGTIAAPVAKDIYSNILPYLGIKKE